KRRLVNQERAGGVEEDQRECEPALLPTAQDRGRLVDVVAAKQESAEQGPDEGRALLTRRRHRVLEARPTEIEHVLTVLAVVADRDPEADLDPPGVGRNGAGQELQESRLPRAVRSD